MGETDKRRGAGFAEGPLWSEVVLGSRLMRPGLSGRTISRDWGGAEVADGHFLRRPNGRSDGRLTASRRYLRRRDPIETFASTIWVWISVTSRGLLMRSCLC